ncbi:MAG: DUF748 domain-containing protein [Gammaproteobacteria bacterium]|nr:DUF748 domain-containing protein [Gammaproteobacteria bacterium]
MLVIESVKLDGLKLDIIQAHSGINSLAGLPLLSNDTAIHKKTPTEPASGQWSIQIGNIYLDDAELCYMTEMSEKKIDQQICPHIEKLKWNGRINIALAANSSAGPDVAGSLTLKNLRIDDIKRNQLLTAINAVEVDNLVVDSLDNIKLDNFVLSGFSVLTRNKEEKLKDLAPQIGLLKRLELNNLKYVNKSDLNIAQVNITGVGIDVLRNQQSKWELDQRLKLITPQIIENKNNQDMPVKKGKSAAPHIRISEINIENSDLLRFTDQSFKSAFQITAQISRLKINNLDSEKPDRKSEITLDMNLNQHGLIQLKGQVAPLSKNKDFELRGKTTAIDLRPMTSYMEKHIGQTIVSGQLDAEMELIARERKLNSNLKLVLHKFKLKVSDKKHAEETEQEMGFPIDSTLNLLREKDNQIKLELSITGDLDKPEFNLSDVITQAATSAITSAVITYYTPFGLVSGAKALFNLATALRFEPVVFQAGSSQLSDNQKQYLSKLSQLLMDKPDVYLTLCGVANITDQQKVFPELKVRQENNKDLLILSPEQREKLLGIASQRSEAVKNYLVTEGKISASRLIICTPEFISEPSAINPGVKISI